MTPEGAPQAYGEALLAQQAEGAARSARILVPLVLKLVSAVRSVVDVGCGTGVWLAQFKELGVARVLGLDGTGDNDRLAIELEEFRKIELQRGIKDERFDLCICLEMAARFSNHTALTIVHNLCRLSDVVLFSAAIPGARRSPSP